MATAVTKSGFGRLFGGVLESGGRVVMLEVGLEDRHVEKPEPQPGCDSECAGDR